MSKNPFQNKNVQPEVKDPVKEAHAFALQADQEAADAEASQVENQESQAAISAFALTPDPVKNVTEAATESPVVQETTTPSAAQPFVSTIKATGANRNTELIDRRNGARARAASPVNTAPIVVGKSEEFKELITGLKRTGTPSVIGLISFMESYVTAMAPRQTISAAAVVKAQEKLYDNLVFIIDKAAPAEFKRLWSVAVAFAREYKDAAFSPVYYSRGARDWQRDSRQFITLTSLLNLLQATAINPDTVNYDVNVNTVAEQGFSEEGRGRLLGYYLK